MMQPSEFRGQLPDVQGQGWTWTNDDTRAWPEKQMARPVRLVPDYRPDWRDLRLTRLALASFCLAAIVASLAIIFISARVVWAVWPK